MPGPLYGATAAPTSSAIRCIAERLTSAYTKPRERGPPAALLEDDFEDGAADGWTTVGGSWNIGNEGSLVYAQNGLYGESIAFAGEASWTDYILEADVKVKKLGGNGGILFRYQDANNFYMFRLNDTGSTADLYKKTGALSRCWRACRLP